MSVAARTSLIGLVLVCATALTGCHGGGPAGLVPGRGDSPAGAQVVFVRGMSVALVDSQGSETAKLLTIPDVAAVQGGLVQMRVNINSISGVAGFQAEVTYDPSLLQAQSVAVTDAIPGSPLELINVDNAAGVIRVAVAGTQNSTAAATVLLDITFAVSADASTATTQVGIGATLADAEAQTVGTTLLTTGSITIAPGYAGDIDGDGNATILDVVQILRIVTGTEPVNPLADANQDGVVDINDAILMVRCVIGAEPWPIGVIGNRLPLGIDSTMPEDGATRVEIHATLVITFNAAVEPTSLTYTLDGGAEGVVPELDAAWNAPHYTEVTLTPRTALSAGTGYTVSGIGASPADTLHYAALSGGRFGFVTAAGRGAPTVSITSPEPGTTVDGVFQVAVTAQPGTGAASVQQVDVVFGDQAQTIEAASGAVTLNSCYLNNGTHAITAVATDTDGVRSEAAAIDVVVDNFAFYIDERVQVVTADAPGASVAVPVSITDATGGVGFSMTINYDPATLSVASAAAVRKGAAVPGNALLIVNAVESGNLYISCAGTEVFDSAQQEILVIDFDIVSRPVGGLTRIDLDDTEDARPSLDWVHTTRGTLRPKAVGGWIDIP